MTFIRIPPELLKNVQIEAPMFVSCAEIDLIEPESPEAKKVLHAAVRAGLQLPMPGMGPGYYARGWPTLGNLLVFAAALSTES